MVANLQISQMSREQWRETCARFQDHGYPQTWAFGNALAARYGAKCEFVQISDGDKLLGVANVRLRRVPMFGGIAYVSGGPLTQDQADEDLPRFLNCVKSLQQEYSVRRKLIFRLRAPIGLETWNAGVVRHLQELGYEFAPGPTYRTVRVNLQRDPEQLRASFGRRWRRGLGQGERAGLSLESGTSPELFAVFCEVYQEMLQQKDFFSELDADFYAELQGQMEVGEKFEIRIARKDGVAVAGVVNSILGNQCVYVLGATNSEGRDLRAAYCLHFDSMVDAAGRDIRWYDAGGIDPEADPGVSTFKLGMQGEDVTAAGPMQAPLRCWSDSVVLAAEKRVRQRRQRSATNQ